jgi:hypothetical protein
MCFPFFVGFGLWLARLSLLDGVTSCKALHASGEMEWVQNWRLRMDFLPVDFLRKIH